MKITDDFRGSNEQLIASITALIKLDAAGALVPHGIGGHARGLLAAAAVRLDAPTAQPVGQHWTAPTKYLQRLGDAIALLCGGKRPSDEIISAWLDAEADDLRLQDFAATHGPSWGQGIGVIDAAMTLADQPTEGVAHEFRAAVEPSQPAPVAYVNGDELDNLLDDRTATIQSAPSGWRRTALYRASTSPAPAAPSPDAVRERMEKFLNAAAGDGIVCGDVDAADLYVELFPAEYAAALAASTKGDAS